MKEHINKIILVVIITLSVAATWLYANPVDVATDSGFDTSYDSGGSYSSSSSSSYSHSSSYNHSSSSSASAVEIFLGVIGVLCKTPNTKYFKNTLPLGETLEEISKNIFTLLRKVDDYKVDLVVIEGVEPTGLGLAIMNRLIRSCSHNYLELL